MGIQTFHPFVIFGGVLFCFGEELQKKNDIRGIGEAAMMSQYEYEKIQYTKSRLINLPLLPWDAVATISFLYLSPVRYNEEPYRQRLSQPFPCSLRRRCILFSVSSMLFGRDIRGFPHLPRFPPHVGVYGPRAQNGRIHSGYQ